MMHAAIAVKLNNILQSGCDNKALEVVWDSVTHWLLVMRYYTTWQNEWQYHLHPVNNEMSIDETNWLKNGQYHSLAV